LRPAPGGAAPAADGAVHPGPRPRRAVQPVAARQLQPRGDPGAVAPGPRRPRRRRRLQPRGARPGGADPRSGPQLPGAGGAQRRTRRAPRRNHRRDPRHRSGHGQPQARAEGAMSEPLILVVDDDPGMLQLLGMRLKAFGFRTLAARSGPEALALLEQHPVHVLVSDLRMEPMDGMALFARVHERWPVLPVIMLTAHGTIRDAVDATREGIFAFLTKPVDRDELHSTLHSALALHRPGAQAGAAPGGETRLLTRSGRMYRLLEQARLYAESDVNILITGESGTGKELLADSIHRASARADKPFVAINCSAIPQELLESELFGYVKGAFTGANQDREGLFSTAEGGTVLLDEIGDMPYALQAKLLRVLQENVLRPVGGRADIPIDVRIISATHIDLPAAIADKRFREDLYYRLNVVSLALPPLRERREDIPLLVEHFLAKIARR